MTPEDIDRIAAEVEAAVRAALAKFVPSTAYFLTPERDERFTPNESD